MKKTIFTIIILLVVIGGFYFLYRLTQNTKEEELVNQELENFQEENQEETEMYGGMTREEFWSQLRAEILQEGEGQEAKNGDELSVHYVGMFEDGTKFDSSLDRGQPFELVLGAGQVIPGWDLGLVGMKKNEARRLFVPSEYGYGQQGAGGVIPPDANLIFEVQLLEISQAGASQAE